MFSPLPDFFDANIEHVISKEDVLGEKNLRLYGAASEDLYLAAGGAVYPPLDTATERSSDVRVGAGVEAGRHYSGAGRGERGTAAAACWSVPVAVWWLLRHPATALFHVLSVLAYYLPLLRFFMPTLVLSGASSPPSFSSLSPGAFGAAAEGRRGRASVWAVAFHPSEMLLAISCERGRVVRVYDVDADEVICALQHFFQQGAEALAWKPNSLDVLAVGCRGGVLLWSLGLEPGSGVGGGRFAGYDAEAARAVFYTLSWPVPVTTMAFFSGALDGHLVCASRASTLAELIDVTRSPESHRSAAMRVSPSFAGGIGCVVTAEDDAFFLATVCDAAVLAVWTPGRSPPFCDVSAPAPVVRVCRASGVGRHCFFLTTAQLDGVLLVRVVPAARGLVVLGTIATPLCRGVGGAVTDVAASCGRVWLRTESGHLLVCQYGARQNRFTLVLAGIASVGPASALASAPAFRHGSLLAISDGTRISFIPSFHL